MAQLKIFTSECIRYANAEKLGIITNKDYRGLKLFHIVTKKAIIKVKPFMKTIIDNNKKNKIIVFKCEGNEFQTITEIVIKYKLFN